MVEWRYLHERSTVKHALGGSSSTTAICGAAHLWFAPSSEWRGTGSQREYERAAELRECKRCVRKLKESK